MAVIPFRVYYLTNLSLDRISDIQVHRSQGWGDATVMRDRGRTLLPRTEKRKAKYTAREQSSIGHTHNGFFFSV